MREGNTKCPRTNEELGRTHFTPNHLLKGIIWNWCKQNQVSFFQQKFEKMSVLELKRELQRVMEEDDDDLGFVHNAFQTLYGLRELKLNQEPPRKFLCPISGILMTDPVVAASGQTFDSAQIQNWVKQGKTKCPKTDQLLSHSVLIPNHSIREMIAQWCKANHLRPPPPSPLTTRTYQSRRVTEGRCIKRHLFHHYPSPNVSPLLTTFMTRQYRSDAALYNDAVATILNITTDDVNKAKIANDCPHLIPFLIQALQGQNTIEIRGYAAAALCELSEIDSNKLVIGESGAVRPLINLLELGHPLASREAASAVLSLITWIGGLAAVMDKLEDHALLDKILEILVSFTNHPRAVEVMGERSVMPRLFSIIVETRSKSDEDNCVVVISAIACSEQRRLLEVEKVADALQILYGLSSNGTARARKKASDLLLRIKGKMHAD